MYRCSRGAGRAIKLPLQLAMLLITTACATTPRREVRPAWVDRQPEATAAVLYQLGRSLGTRNPEEARALAADDGRLQVIEQVVGVDLGMRSTSLSGADAEILRRKVIVLGQRVHLKSVLRGVHVESSTLGEGRFDGYVLMEFDRAEVEREGDRIRSLPPPNLDQDLRIGTEGLTLPGRQPTALPENGQHQVVGGDEQPVRYRLGGIIAFDVGYVGNSLSRLDNGGFSGGSHVWFSWSPRWTASFRFLFTTPARDDRQGIRTNLQATPDRPAGTLLEGGIQYFLEDPRYNAAPWFIQSVVYRRTTPITVRVSQTNPDNVAQIGTHREWGAGALAGVETRIDNPRKGGINFRAYGGLYRGVFSTDSPGTSLVFGASFGMECGW